MPNDRYRFKLGDFNCVAIRDCSLTFESKKIFTNVDKDSYKPQLKARGEKGKKVTLEVGALAVLSDDWVLIDAGYGHLGTEVGRVPSIVNDEDIRPEHIILTHAHPDHFGGLINENGEATFGNTPIYICQHEWMVTTSSEYAKISPARAEYVQKHFHKIEREIQPIECLHMSEILPGFSVLNLPGHTEHHIGVLIESGGESLICIADALVHPLFLENLDWHCGFDDDHEAARESRIKLAELAIEMNALVIANHFPFPGIGRIERKGDGYKWLPINA